MPSKYDYGNFTDINDFAKEGVSMKTTPDCTTRKVYTTNSINSIDFKSPYYQPSSPALSVSSEEGPSPPIDRDRISKIPPQKSVESTPKRRRKRKREEIESDNRRLDYLRAKKNKTKEEKSELRKLRNRWSAQKSRNKRRKLMETKDKEISDLKRENKLLKEENTELIRRLQKYENVSNRKESKESKEQKNEVEKKRKKTHRIMFGLIFLFGFLFFGVIPSMSNMKIQNSHLKVLPNDHSITGRELTTTTTTTPIFASANKTSPLIQLYEKSDSVMKQNFDPGILDYTEVLVPGEVAHHLTCSHDDYYPHIHGNEFSNPPMLRNETSNVLSVPNHIDKEEEERNVNEFGDSDGGIVPYNEDGDYDDGDYLGYIFKENLDDQTMFLYCPKVFPLYSTRMDFEKDQKIVLVYPTEKYNESNERKPIHKLSGIEVDGVAFSDYFMQLKLRDVD